MRALVAAVVLAATVVSLPAQTPNWRLKVATLAPRGSVWFKELAQVASEWKLGSRSRAEMVIFWGGTLGDEEAVVRKIRLGQLQGAWLTAIGLARIDASFNALNMPLFYASTDELFCVVDKLMPALAERAEPRGFVVLSPGYAGWVQMFTTHPTGSVDELKRLKIWTSVGDDRMVRWYKDNGFRPVPLSTTDIMVGLKVGAIEAFPTTPLAALSMQYYKQAPHMLELDLAPLPGALGISVEAWESLPEDLQSNLRDAAAASWSRMQVSVPDADRRAVEVMRHDRKFTLTRVKDSPTLAAAFEQQAHEYAAAMRGTWVPADVYDLAAQHRDACRARKDSAPRAVP
jgi:TRAP-type C4-dicarboxylate transport system substrate-binding protein